MASSRALLLSVLVLAMLRVQGARGWGHDGHLYVCAIAQGLLSDEASARVKGLLPDWAKGYMPNVCSWADYVGHATKEWHWSLPLHFVDTPNVCNFDFKRDCNGNCVVSAILNYTSQLQDLTTKLSSTPQQQQKQQQQQQQEAEFPIPPPSQLSRNIQEQAQSLRSLTNPRALAAEAASASVSAPELRQILAGSGPSVLEEVLRTLMQQKKGSGDRDPYDPSVLNPTVALMFLVHFIGDIHQPLHVSFKSDYGGNRILVKWYKKHTNLHEVWDTEIVKLGVKEYFNTPLNFTLSLAQRLSGVWAVRIPGWVACASGPVCPSDFASESIQAACEWAYKGVKSGDTLEDPYFVSRFPVVEIQLVKAGVRLAATLNRIFSSHQINAKAA